MADIKVSQMGEVLVANDNDLLNLVTYDDQNQTYVSGKVKASTLKSYMVDDLEVSDLYDTTITTPTDDDGLVYDATAQKWKNKQITTKDQWKKNGAYNHLPFPYSETSQVRDGATFVVASNGKITVSGVPSNPPDFSYLRLVSFADSMAFASTYAGTSVKFCLCSSSATGLSLKVEGLDASNNTVFTQTGIQEGTVINIPSSVVKWEVLLVVANTFSGASTIVTPMFTTDLNATYDDFVPYAKTNRELTEFGKCMFTVSGTTGAVNTEIQIPFPSGYSATDFVVLGYTIRNSNSMWYSNYGATVFTDSADGVRVTPTQNGFNNQPVKVLIALV